MYSRRTWFGAACKAANAKGNRTKTRPIQGIDQNVQLNRGLWVLAEEMRKLKAA